MLWIFEFNRSVTALVMRCFILLRRQRLPQLLGRLAGWIFHHIHHAGLVQIGQQRDGGLPPLEALLIHPQMFL
jgi:hypothetical protein